jgi:hypothetical protein
MCVNFIAVRLNLSDSHVLNPQEIQGLHSCSILNLGSRRVTSTGCGKREADAFSASVLRTVADQAVDNDSVKR